MRLCAEGLELLEGKQVRPLCEVAGTARAKEERAGKQRVCLGTSQLAARLECKGVEVGRGARGGQRGDH